MNSGWGRVQAVDILGSIPSIEKKKRIPKDRK
jgi:hypothetical protein